MRLGSITFMDYEIPTKINFGGRQALASHRLAGGRRVIDVLGPDSDSIIFSGTFSGRGALSRATAVDFLRRCGTNTTLLWDELSFDVVVSAFSADFMNTMWIPYKCTCTVIANSVSSTATRPLQNSDIPRLSTSMLATAAALIQTLPELTGLSVSVETQGSWVSSSDAISQAQGNVVAGLAAATQDLTTNLAVNDASVISTIAKLADLEAATQSLSMLTTAKSYLWAAASETVAS